MRLCNRTPLTLTELPALRRPRVHDRSVACSWCTGGEWRACGVWPGLDDFGVSQTQMARATRQRLHRLMLTAKPNHFN